jgi:uncharacterized Zn-binding protein involved in type VI secretion
MMWFKKVLGINMMPISCEGSCNFLGVQLNQTLSNVKFNHTPLLRLNDNNIKLVIHH